MKTFQVVEIGKGIRETYFFTGTEKEVTAYLKGKTEANGYIPGMGGDKNYSITAWSLGKCGEGYVDLERIWVRMSFIKAA